MTVNELIAMFRTETADIEVPYLWTEDEVVTYLNDAYFMLVRFMGGVADSASAPCTVAVPANATTIPIDPSFIRITRAFRVSDGVEISVIEDNDTPLVRDSSGKLTLLRVGSTTGPIQFIVVGADALTARIHPIPAAPDSIAMHVRRLPSAQLVAGTNAMPDIRTEHHLHLLKWMKAMAYRKQDTETLGPAKAAENENLFLQYCSQAVHEQERMRRKSRTSLRTERDLKNPLLAGGAYKQYSEPAAPRRRAEPQ